MTFIRNNQAFYDHRMTDWERRVWHRVCHVWVNGGDLDPRSFDFCRFTEGKSVWSV